MRKSWEDRQIEFGNSPRSVLFRNLPDWVNRGIHQRHMRFILSNLPGDAKSLLDIGCGYGRISQQIKQTHSELCIQGVELCEAFALEFQQTIGPCAISSIEDHQPDRKFDCILSVTCLQYVSEDQFQTTLEKYWAALNPGGRFICIEQYENLIVKWRKNRNMKSMSPTGGDIKYFQNSELRRLMESLPGAGNCVEKAIPGLPIGFPVMHHALSVSKSQDFSN